MFLTIGGLIKAVAVASLFFGILSGLAIDIMGILADPFSAGPYKQFGLDIGKIFLNSQKEISNSIDEFEQAEDATFKNYLIWRIVGASLLSILLIYGFYKVIIFITPSSNIDLGSKLVAIFGAILLVWMIGLITNIFLSVSYLTTLLISIKSFLVLTLLVFTRFIKRVA